MALPFLPTIGLTKNEADVYELLLQLGEVPVWKIQQKAELKRPTLYLTLQNLEKKGLVSKRDFEKKIHFRPEPPTKLLSLAEQHYNELDRAKSDLQTILPELTSQYIISVEKPVISTYEGIDGIKKVFQDIYAPKNEPVYGCVDLEKSDEAVPSYIVKKLIPLRIKNKVFAKTFLGESPAAKDVANNDENSLRESLLLDKKRYPLPAEIDVYEDKVAMLSFTKGQFVGVMIQNQDIATSLKTIFKLAFEANKSAKTTPQHQDLQQ